ncbi:tripartite tricarboxylate transporter substrate binding protein [Brevibacillus agri]|uniref:Bug family tripartite tricarboxylate transporter substrate binding protein n=1 Tax=Brevibacillus agri TaxID=51101 RepID=UPI002E1E39C1|nr:tripartite tricarboxylate transporter substrate binding protein [Brevibacillus agri]
MIVPFAPGGTTDTAARSLAGVISKYMPNGQTVAVVNKDGGGGTIGVSELFQAKGDGYTIGMVTSGPMTIKPHSGQVAYKPEDFKPVVQVVATPNVLIVKADSPWKTFDEWLEYVKANPGQFSYGTSGAGLTQHITMESFSAKTGAKLTHVPFNGGSPAIMALLGGNVTGAFVQTTEAVPYVKDGSARPIFIAGTFKPEELKDVPLLSEKNIDVRGDVWTGIVTPKDVPDEIIATLHEAFKKAMEDPAVVDQFKKIGATTVYKGPADFQAIINQEYTANGEVLQAIGLKK